MLPLTARSSSSAAASSSSSFLRRGAASVTKVSPTIRVAAHDVSGAQTSAISVVLKAGSRYEPEAGVANVLKNMSFKSNEHESALGLTRRAELLGTTLSATLSRETLTLTAECAKGDERSALQILASSLRPKHFTHEYKEIALPTILLEANHAAGSPDIKAYEALHALAFRSGLGASIFASPSEPVSLGDVKAFWASVVGPTQAVGVVGTGLSQENLTNLVKHVFVEALDAEAAAVPADAAGALKPTKTVYHGGEERLAFDLHALDHASPTVLVGFGLAAAATPAHDVLPYLLGTTPASLKWGATSVLARAALSAGGEGTTASAALVSYSDATLLAVEVQAGGSKRLSAATAEVVKTLKAFKVSKESLKAAVAKAKLEVASKWETHEGAQALLAAKIFEDSVPDVQDAFKAFDGLTVEGVQKALDELLKSKPSVVSIGRLSQTVYADEMGL